MGAIGDLEVKITGDASGLLAALEEAKGGLGDFGNIAGAVFAGLGAAGLFNEFTGGFEGIVSSLVNTSAEFQSWGSVINAVGSDASSMFSDIGDSVGGMATSAQVSALEAQDALIRYQEKVQEIQDNIKTIMSGQDILDAQEKLQSKLSDLLDQYSQKVQSIHEQINNVVDNESTSHEDRVQSMNDTLQDMQDSFNVQQENKNESRQSEMAKATNDFTKKYLQEKYAAEDKLAQDNFNRRYNLKKSQEERNIAEADARQKAADDKKIAALNAELAKEDEAYKKQQDKAKTASEQEITRLEASDAKKLAMYKQELADEERAYQLSIMKREVADTGGGGAAGLLKLERNSLQANDALAKTTGSASKLLSYLDDISTTTPFRLEDLESVSQLLLQQNVDASELLPTIQNLSGFFQKNLGETANAVLMAMHGRTMQLKNDFNITSGEMQQALGKPLKTSNDVLEALIKLTNTHFSKGVQIESDTVSGHMNTIDNQITKVKLAFMGISEVTGKPISGGLFDTLSNAVGKFSDYLNAHGPEIMDYVKKIGTVFNEMFKVIEQHKDVLIAALKLIGVAIVSLGLLIVGAITGAIIVADTFYKAWQTSVKFTQDALSGFEKFFGGMVDSLKGHFDKLVKYAKDAFSYLNPFAKHSPSLVDQVTAGVGVIKQQYESLSGLNIPSPTLKGITSNVSGLSGMRGASSIYAPRSANNYTYQNISQPSVQISNNFDIKGEENAVGFAEYLGFQLEHKGIV